MNLQIIVVHGAFAYNKILQNNVAYSIISIMWHNYVH